MGDTNIPKPQSSGKVMQSYMDYLPGLIASTAAQTPTIAQNQLNATLATQPLYNALNLQQAQQYALPLAQVGQEVQRANALAGGETQLAQLKNTGIETARLAQQVAREGSPEYYRVMDPASRNAVSLMDAINLNGLSAGEQAAAERSLGQSQVATGNLGLDNATNAVSNAMMFGDRYNQKLGQMSSALGSAVNVANAANPNATGFNAVNVALGQPNSSTLGNFGTGTFSNTNAGTQNATTGQAFGFGQGTMGNLSSMNNAAMGGQSSAYGSQMGLIGSGISGLGSVGGGAAGGCCFIMLESYHGTMPSYVRKCRDHYYRSHPAIARGYVKMAKWLVPMMKKSSVVRSLVWHFMVEPITNYGAFLIERRKKTGKLTTRFWFTIWNILGKERN